MEDVKVEWPTVAYVVEAEDGNDSFTRNYTFNNRPFPHSSHLVSIMQYLDDEGLDLVSITVVS